jgi:hypothetical protein
MFGFRVGLPLRSILFLSQRLRCSQARYKRLTLRTLVKAHPYFRDKNKRLLVSCLASDFNVIHTGKCFWFPSSKLRCSCYFENFKNYIYTFQKIMQILLDIVNDVSY